MDNHKNTVRLLPSIIAAFVSALVTLIFYLPTLGFEFVNWDDQACVYENPNISSINSQFLKYAFTAIVNSNWHPLTVISYALDYSIWELNPLGYHLTNIVFHAATTFLVALLAAQIVSRLRGYGAIFAGLFAGILFGLHPLHVESVAWVAERKDVLSGFFFVLSVLLYLRYARLSSKAAFVLSILSFILALLSKPMAMTLPLVLLLLDYYPLNRLTNIKRCIIEKLPFFVLSIATGIITVWAQRSVEAVAPLDAYPISVRILVSIKAYAFYIYKTVVPASLAPFYPRRMDDSFASVEFIVAVVLLAAITAFALFMAKRSRAYITAWLFYLITLFPVIGVVQVGSQAAADRYMYIPSISIFILASFGVVYLLEKLGSKAFTASAVIAFVIIGVVTGGLTLKQSAVWKDSISLWSRQIEVYPEDAPIGYNNLGLAYKAKGDLQRALYQYEKALSIDPYYSDAYNNRGNIFMRAGDFKRAIEDFSTAFRINPMNLEAISNRGAARVNSGDLAGAVEDISKAISLSPENAFFARNYFNRGLAYKGLKEDLKAIEDFSKTIEFEPMFAPAYLNRGIIYLNAGDADRAIRDLGYAIEINPSMPAAYLNLGIAFIKKGDSAKASVFLQKASSMGSAQAESILKTLRP